jgi:hypothetical protein
MTITMTQDQSAMYLSSIKAARNIAMSEIKAQIRAQGAAVGQSVIVLTASGAEAWRDVG